MLDEIGIIKLSKYHFYKNEIIFFNNYKNDIISRFGSLDNLPVQILRNMERERFRLKRYAEENSINDITEEILSTKTSH
jgi:hypothetical protein